MPRITRGTRASAGGPGKISDQADPPYRRLRGRRRQRHHRARIRPKTVRKPRPARHRRKQAGRRRHRRDRLCRKIRARWLHAADERQRPVDQPGRLRQASLRRGEGFCRGVGACFLSVDHDRCGELADQIGSRACRLRESQSGQDELWEFVGLIPARHRTVQAEDRRADAGHPLQERQRIGARRHLRPGDDDDRGCGSRSSSKSRVARPVR